MKERGRKAHLVARLPVEGWQEVVSSSLAAVLYREADRILYVRFKSGAVYAYSEVPWSAYQGLLDAGSKGMFFHANIKGRYPFSGPLAS